MLVCQKPPLVAWVCRCCSFGCVAVRNTILFGLHLGVHLIVYDLLRNQRHWHIIGARNLFRRFESGVLCILLRITAADASLEIYWAYRVLTRTAQRSDEHFLLWLRNRAANLRPAGFREL